MTEYIERLAAIEAAIDEFKSTLCDDLEAWMFEARLNAVPAADVAPVIRCKDCVWFADNNNGEWYGCWLFNAIRAGDTKPTLNDYCSYGERKDMNE